MSGHPLETPQYGFRAKDFAEGGWIRSWMGNHQNIVNGPKAVSADLPVLGITLPMAVHQKLIFIPADIQNQDFFPYTFFVFFHGMCGLTPAVKVARQGNLGGFICA